MVDSLIMIFLKHLELLVLWKIEEPPNIITNPKYHVWLTLKDSSGSFIVFLHVSNGVPMYFIVMCQNSNVLPKGAHK